MNTKQGDILSTQKNAENNPKQNSTLTEREPIQGTPFTLIKTIHNHDPLTDRGDEQWFMVMGDYRVTETTKTKGEQIDKLDTEKWLLIMHICIIALERMKKSDRDFQQYQKNIHKTEEENQAYETESL